MPSVISGDANVSATEFGYLDGVTSALQTQMDSKLPLAGGKILQIVRATDSTNRTTTSGTFVDASISVTITPQKSDSAVLIVWQATITTSALTTGSFQVTDNSNNAISGAENVGFTLGGGGYRGFIHVVAYATPATTSAVTYKGRFLENTAATLTIQNGSNTGQMYAIEVSA